MSNPHNENIIFNKDDIDLGKIFRLILMQSKIIGLIIFLGISAGVASYFFTERTYKINSLLQVLNDQSSFSRDMSIDLFMGSNATTDFDNLELLYKSRTNMSDVILANKLNIEVKNNFSNPDEFIEFFEVNKFSPELREFVFEFSENTFLIKSEIGSDEFSYDKVSSLGNVTFQVKKPTILPDLPTEIRYTNPENLYNFQKSKFSVTSSNKRAIYTRGNGGLLEVSYLTNDVENGMKVLNYANNLFIKNNIESESETARSAIDFIDKNIDSIGQELEENKQKLSDFRERNKTVDVDLEIESIIQVVQTIESKINELNLEIAKASGEYTRTNPIYLSLIDQREELEKQKNTIEDEIGSLPFAQQNYIDLFRNVESSQKIYSELLDRKLEFSIKEASTLGNIRVIDPAYMEAVTNPRLSSIFYWFVFSVFGAFVFAIIRGMYFMPISNPAELPDSNIHKPILGVIPKVNPDSSDSGDEEKFRQSFESLVVNLKTTLETKNKLNRASTIVITSPSPSNGKSFVSRNLSQKIADLGDKVVLLDCDLKRGDQHTDLGQEKISQKEFLEIDEHNIEKYKISENFYLIPKITRLTNSFQFLYSTEFDNKIKFLQEHFDYLVIDTAPLLSVSDTSILLSYADLSVGVTKHGLNKINEIKQMISISEQVGISFDGLVYNSYEKPSSYYGYYGLYGNYAYQYYAKKYLYENYDYKKED